MSDELRQLEPHQQYCCGKGCGACKPVQIDFVYSEERDMDDNLISKKSYPIWVSHCCHVDMMIWDDNLDGFID
jgi:hypothetical protein